MLEQLEPALIKLFVAVVGAFGVMAVRFVVQYARHKSKSEHLLGIEIGGRILTKILQDSINSSEEYHYALVTDKTGKTPGKGKLLKAVEIAVDSIAASQLPTLAAKEVETLINAELGKMRANGKKG